MGGKSTGGKVREEHWRQGVGRSLEALCDEPSAIDTMSGRNLSNADFRSIMMTPRPGDAVPASASNAAKKPKVVDPDKERRKEKYRMLARKKRQNKDKGGDDAAKKEESKY